MKILIISELLIGIMCACVDRVDEKNDFEWSELKKTKDVECSVWPIQKKDLGVTKLDIIGDRKRWLFAYGVARNMSKVAYISLFSGSVAKDLTKIKELNWNNSSRFLGGGVIDNLMVLISAGVDRKKGNGIEMERIAENGKVINNFIQHEAISDGRAYVINSKVWILYKTINSEGLIEDEPFKISVFDVNTKSSIHRNFGKVGIHGNPKLFYSKKNKTVFAIWLEKTSVRGKKKAVFKYGFLDETNSQFFEDVLNFHLKDDVELWNVEFSDEKIFLSYVDGNSLIEESVLKIIRVDVVDKKLRVGMETKILFGNEQISNPILFTRRQTLYVVIPKWIEKESTLGFYKMEKGKIVYIENLGVFPEGSVLEDYFYDESLDHLYGILKKRRIYGFDFNICRLVKF
ncbi:MAG: hypothetical protein HQK54_02640 [Oligoflexales bacterium]|nr:hypothetical protein [Oligoflexales bacterium]